MTPLTGETSSLGPVIDSASVIVCAGAGGVGKTTTAAAIALAASRRGRRAVVVTVDPAKRLADAIGVSLAHEPTRVEHEGPGSMWATMLDTKATFDDLVRRTAATSVQAEDILANRFYRNLTGSLSGTQEYMAAEKLYELHGDDRFDLVIVDTPPARNALDFLDAPERLTRFLDHRLYRMLAAPTRIGLRVANAAAQTFLKGLTKVVGGEAIAEVIGFFRAFDGMEDGFRRRATDVLSLLRSTDTAYVLVTSPRREAVDEARFFAEHLRRQNLAVAAVIANRVHPDFGPAPAPTSPPASTALAALEANLRTLQAAVGSERAALAPLLDRDGSTGAARLVPVPLLSHDVHDLTTLGGIADRLAPPR